LAHFFNIALLSKSAVGGKYGRQLIKTPLLTPKERFYCKRNGTLFTIEISHVKKQALFLHEETLV
jgi:hypothetical protein